MKHLSLALVLIIAAGCATGPAAPTDPQLRKAVAAADAGHYTEAVATYRKAAVDTGPDAAEALFQAAYLLAYFENPQKDYALALQGFEEYIKRYPKGPRIREARNWRFVLKGYLELKSDNTRLNQKIDQLKKIDILHEEKRVQD